jgi:hypothetical protein
MHSKASMLLLKNQTNSNKDNEKEKREARKIGRGGG